MSDEIQFKPLSEGLGFHKKPVNLKDDSTMPLPTTTGILPKSKVSPKPQQFHSPPMAKNSPSVHPLTGWAPALPKASLTDTKVSAKKPSPCPIHWSAAFLDCSMVAGLAFLFSAAVFAVTDVGLGELTAILSDDFGAQLAVAVLLIAVFEIYSIGCRSFFGKTLGEWAFDLKLGTPQERDRMFYPLWVAWRSLLIAVTGFFLLPVLSSVTGTDLAGLFSGLSLYSEKE